MTERGSRKHILDWTGRPDFAEELVSLLAPVRCRMTPTSTWMPRGRSAPAEARLSQFGPASLPSIDWRELSTWWLKHSGNTPNWDLALQCDVEGQPGLVLVEAKANVPELSAQGKRVANERSVRSDENHAHIGAAIAEAQRGLSAVLPGINIGHTSHYQLANRLAFGWKLATMGVPTVLLYTGFTGDEGIRDAGEPFADDAHWQAVFRAHLSDVCALCVLDVPLDLGVAKLWLLSRSTPVLRSSPARGRRPATSGDRD